MSTISLPKSLFARLRRHPAPITVSPLLLEVAHSPPEAAYAKLLERHGFERIEPAIVGAFSARIEYARSSHVDYKTELQEALARSGKQVHYTVLEVEGPPHDRRFVCAAHVAGAQFGIGRGSTKKAAEQEAARQALDALGVVPERI